MTYLSVVLLQYEAAGKYPHALRRLMAVLDRLREVDLKLVLVDNVREGDWQHQVSEGVLQIGGDNRAWEFSAFDKGIATLESWRRRNDVFVLVTDAFQAYDEEYLGLIDDQVVRCANRLPAAVGWVDSFPQACRIGDLAYDAYLRSSFLFLPRSALAAVRPLAADLEAMNVFGTDAARPFASGGALSANLQELLVEWLTTTQAPAPHLAERWHSAFELTPDSYPFFRQKASAILREHLLSARLKAHGIAAYDFRCIRYLHNRGDLGEFLASGGNNAWQWLGWRALLRDGTAAGAAVDPLPASIAGAPTAADAPALLLAGELGLTQSLEAAHFVVERVLPLVRQRFGSAYLLAVTGTADDPPAFEPEGSVRLLPSSDELRASGLLDSCVAVIAPPGSSPDCLDFVDELAADGFPLLASGAMSAAGRPSLAAESAVEYATACCELINRRLTGERQGVAGAERGEDR